MLRLKPLIEARAKANQDERTDIREKSHEVESPIRTDEAVASLANMNSNPISKTERMEATA